MKYNTRRRFIRDTSLATLSIALAGRSESLLAAERKSTLRKVGIIGLDTEHSLAFTKVLNDPAATMDVSGFKVVAAYPYGSKEIPFSVKAIPEYTRQIQEQGVAIMDSIEDLLLKVDVVLLETNDGRLHLEQALPVIKSGKPLFIDKPIAASLADALFIFEAASKYNVPVFSSSSLRFMKTAQDLAAGKLGRVLGADTYSPAYLEKTHPDLFWYGVHGVETLFTLMGTGCQKVAQTSTEGFDLVVGTWEDNRIGSFRGTRLGQDGFGGTVFGEKGIGSVGPWEGYGPLVAEIVKFFRTGKAPVTPKETLEIFAFMEAAYQSKLNNGKTVELAAMMEKAAQFNKKRRHLMV